MGTAAAGTGKFTYQRHEPEKTLLYRVLAREWDNWFAGRQADTSRSPLPTYVEREIEAYFRCGRLEYGFVLVSCDACDEALPVAFSCKKRGFCASCSAKRKSETAVHLVDNVLPHTAYRQWVTTFPHALRFWMAASRKLTSKVHQLVVAMITHYYINAAEEMAIKDPQAGGVTFVQRFGSALNLNVHMHTIVMDGVFSVAGTTPVFFQLRGPSDEEVADIVAAVAHTVIGALRKGRYLPEEGVDIEHPAWLDEAFAESEQLSAVASASATMHIAFGERAGRKVRRIGRGFGDEEETPSAKGKRCYSVNGFTIHANRYIGPQERGKLEELLAYGARGSFANDRLSLLDSEKPDGDLVYSLKRPWSDGTEGVVMSPSEIIEKIVALIPPPYVHLTRYFGVLSSHSKYRRRIILRPGITKGFVAATDGSSPQRLSWSKLLARVFKIDVTRCKQCGARVYPADCDVIVLGPLIVATLAALGLSCERAPRGPPRRAYFDPDMAQQHPDLD
jgi:hypothetical protein